MPAVSIDQQNIAHLFNVFKELFQNFLLHTVTALNTSEEKPQNNAFGRNANNFTHHCIKYQQELLKKAIALSSFTSIEDASNETINDILKHHQIMSQRPIPSGKMITLKQ